MPSTEKHTSKSFDAELADVLKAFSAIGNLAANQVTDATHALIENDTNMAKKVIEGDKVINKMEVNIDEQILLIVAKRQPAANDLRLMMVLSKGVVDLERIGDEASNIASKALQLITESGSPYGYAEVQHLSNQVRVTMLEALNAFTHMNAERALEVLQSNNLLSQEYHSASRALMTYIMEDSHRFSRVINLLWVLRALERIGKHAINLAELVIYATSGYDVRHTDFGTVEQVVKSTMSPSTNTNGNPVVPIQKDGPTPKSLDEE